MTTNEIVNDLAKNKFVEGVVKSYRLTTPYTEDLCQDIYLWLCEKEEDKIDGLYKRGELDYFIKRMVKNNIFSKTSPFYTKYEKYRKKADDDIEKVIDRRDED